MKFIVEYKNISNQHLLNYIAEECSFYMGKITNKIDIELMLNKLSLAVSENRVVHVSGFCGLDKSMEANYKVPKFKTGILKVQYDLKPGFAYEVNNHSWPVYINSELGWICIGDPLTREQAIEFIKGCVAVLEDGQLAALWLKPKSLPCELHPPSQLLHAL